MVTQTKPPPAGVGAHKGRFGTFAGVFTPNVLTILGLILFLRTGWVVGQAGLGRRYGDRSDRQLITLLTGLSLSAIATSMNVRTGGNYYLISRSLGLEIGGAIGIPLYLSQAISVAFYLIGFTEALQSVALLSAHRRPADHDGRRAGLWSDRLHRRRLCAADPVRRVGCAGRCVGLLLPRRLGQLYHADADSQLHGEAVRSGPSSPSSFLR